MEKATTETSKSPVLFNRWHGAALILAGLAFLYLIVGLPYAAGYGDYRQSMATWLKTSWQDATWQHGILAPLITGFLVWRVRHQLKRLPISGSVVGALLTLFGLFAYWVGYRGNFYFIGYSSMQLLAGSAVLLIMGWPFFKKISFAWIMLAFSWPYLFLENTLAFKLRVLMVESTAAILNFVGLGTHQDGTRLISMATDAVAAGEIFTLSVDGPCSGLRSLFALMMVSALFSYFRQRTWWRRCLLFACSFPLAVLANMVRLFLLIGATMLFGQEFAIGRGEEYTSNFHLLAGIFVYFIALAGLLATDKLIHKLFGREKPLPVIVR